MEGELVITDSMKRDLLKDCDDCQVPDECRPYNKLCGWFIGVDAGKYPGYILNAPPSLTGVLL